MEWKILTPLETVKIGKALWMTTEDMVFQTPKGIYTVPKWFVFDHASVPRIFTSIVPPVKSSIAEASVLHDWFYVTDSEDVPRKFADQCLRHLTIANEGSKLLAFNAYTAVRVGAIFLYNKESHLDKLVGVYKRYQGLEHKDSISKVLKGEI